MKLNAWHIILIILAVGAIIYLYMENVILSAMWQEEDPDWQEPVQQQQSIDCQKVLSVGSRNEEVRIFQKWFNDRKYWSTDIATDGVFGPETEQALMTAFSTGPPKKTITLEELNINLCNG